MGYQHDGGFAQFMLVPAKVIAVGGLNRIPGRHRARRSVAGRAAGLRPERAGAVRRNQRR
jgi:hypothetical protein